MERRYPLNVETQVNWRVFELPFVYLSLLVITKFGLVEFRSNISILIVRNFLTVLVCLHSVF